MKYLVLIFLSLLMACSDDNNINIDQDTLSLDSLVTSHAQFTKNLLNTLASDEATENENIIVSPLSLQIALYMTINGAENDTESEMAQTLGLNDFEDNNHNEATRSLLNSFTGLEENTRLELNQAAFYDNNKINLNETFKSELKDYYETEFVNLDFNTQKAVDDINAWVSDKTENRIPKVLEQIDPVEALFLINTLYLKGDWENGFPEYSIMPGPFNLLDGSSTEVDMMSQDSERLFYQSENFDAVSLPLKGGEIAVQFFVPKNTMNLNGFLNSLNATESNSILNYNSGERYNQTRIFLQMPQFELKGKYQLNNTLKAMGMVEAFNPSEADLTDIGMGSGNIFINRVLHDTYLKVDEKGVEGGAVTTVGIAITSAPPVVKLDRPFFFTIVHVPTNSLIFTGYVVNPES